LVTLENLKSLTVTRSHLHNFFPFFFNRTVFLAVTIASIPEYHLFIDLSSPISCLLDLLLPFLQPSVPRLHLSVIHCLLRSDTACLPTKLASKIIFIMGKKRPKQLEALKRMKGDQVEDPVGSKASDAFLEWRSTLSARDVSRLRKAYAIPNDVIIHIPRKVEGATPSGYNHEVTVYEVMFKAGLSLPLNPLFYRLLAELNLAPSQIKPTGWVLLVSFCILWKMAERHNAFPSVKEFLSFYRPANYREGWSFQGCPYFIKMPERWHAGDDYKKGFFFISSVA
jgi:hypothetical protein